MTLLKNDESFVNVLRATANAFTQLYYDDCITVTINPYSDLRQIIEGVMIALRPDTPVYKVKLSEEFKIERTHISIVFNHKTQHLRGITIQSRARIYCT